MLLRQMTWIQVLPDNPLNTSLITDYLFGGSLFFGKVKRMNILIIDDNEVLLTMLTEDLPMKRGDYNITPSNCGESGLSEFMDHKDKYDLVIVDMKMPCCDGIEVIQKVRIAKPDVKIIGISGGGEIDYLVLAKDYGADDLMYKPFLLEELITLIDSLFCAKKTPS